jgi:WD40 repeat protein
MIIDFSFSDKEKEFFKTYIEFLKKYYKEPQKLQIFLELKALEQGIENLNEVIEKFNEFLRVYLFFKTQRVELEKIVEIPHDIISILKEYPYFVEYEAQYNFPHAAIYRGFKWRPPFVIAAGNDGLVRIWKYQNGKFIFLKEIGEKIQKFVAYEIFKDHLFYAKDGILKVFYLPSGKLVKEIDTGNDIKALNLDNGRLYLYKVFGKLAIKQNVDLQDGKVIFGPADPVAPNMVSTGEVDVITVERKLLRLKNGKLYLFTGEKKQTAIKLQKENIYKIGFPINDILVLNQIAILGVDGTSPLIFDLQREEVSSKLEIPVIHTYRIKKNPTCEEIALSHSDNLISVWDISTLQPKKILEGYNIDVLALDYSPDGKYLAASGESIAINIWNTETWEKTVDIDLPTEGITALAFSEDGKYLAAGGEDGVIYLLNTETWNIEDKLDFHEECVSDLLFFGNKLISASWDGKAVLWNLETKDVEKILESSDDRVWRLALSQDKRLLAIADWEGKVSVLNTYSWEVVEHFIDESGVNAVFFGKDKLLIGRKNGLLEVIALIEEETVKESGIKDISANPSENAKGVVTFDGNVLIFTEKNALNIWNSIGDRVFYAKFKNEPEKVENLREPRLEVKVLPDTYIVRKDTNFFGAKDWEKYVNIIKGLEIVENKALFLKEITKPELLKEL